MLQRTYHIVQIVIFVRACAKPELDNDNFLYASGGRQYRIMGMDIPGMFREGDGGASLPDTFSVGKNSHS